MTTEDKIGVLAEAAKYDASCSTAGSSRANTANGTGNAAVGGICHAWSSDGRCVALLKVLLTNSCAYDCAYCVNRRSNDIRRASFDPDELVHLIMDFYRRNYIEGAFLSSGVLGCPDRTMERLVSVAKTLRTREGFNGYIHMKVIPGSSDRLVMEAARWADRVSVNIELPSAASLAHIAPDKTPRSIFGPMRTLARASGFEPRALIAAPECGRVPAFGQVRDCSRVPECGPTAAGPASPVSDWPGLPEPESSPAMTVALAEPRPLYDSAQDRPSVMEARAHRTRNPGGAILPAGQTTQLVVGASPESDALILNLAENLYLAYDVRRVYYSAFISSGADPRLPVIAGPPLAREHRLYQADWLFRFYGFSASEILDPARPNLDPALDPKSDWALRNIDQFPVEINTADYSRLLRIPGIGPKSASRILKARRSASLGFASLIKLGVIMKRARWFITCSGKLPDIHSAGSVSLLDDPLLLHTALTDPLPRSYASAQFEFSWDSPS